MIYIGCRWEEDEEDDFERRLWGKYKKIKSEREEWSKEKDEIK